METIKKYISNQKEKSRLQKETQLKSEFKVVERGGLLWLTHQNVAFMKISSYTNTEDIVKDLIKARNCAIEFDKL